MAKTRIACAVAGVVSLIAAALLAWWITPSFVARVPDGRVSHRIYAGTFQTLIDPAALASGDLLGAVKSNLPMPVDQVVKVEKASGDTALVSDSRTISAAGNKVEQTRWEYAVDRTSLEAVSSHPSDWAVVPARGLTVNWPLGAEKKTYQGWTPETQTTTPLTFLRTESKQGLTTYVFEAKVPPTKIVDQQILAAMPKSLPASVLKLLAGAGTLPAAQAAQLTQLLPQLPDPVPLAYTFQDASTFWVDPDTGLVIQVQRTQQRVAEIALPDGTAVPLLPAVVATYRTTDASAASAADEARHGSTVISWLGVYLPIILLVLGVVLLAVAAVLRGRGPGPGRRRRTGPVADGGAGGDAPGGVGPAGGATSSDGAGG